MIKTCHLKKVFFYIGKVKRTLPDDKSWQQNPEEYNLHRVQEISVHGGFIQKIWMNDIAIITVKKPFKFSQKIGKIFYPENGDIKAPSLGWKKNYPDLYALWHYR